MESKGYQLLGKAMTALNTKKSKVKKSKSAKARKGK